MEVYRIQTEDGEELATGSSTEVHERYPEAEVIEDVGPYINNQTYRVLRSEILEN